MKTKKGFTLVELLVVIAILAILATATIVGFTAFTQKAKQSNLEGEMKQVVELLQLEDYYNGNFVINDETHTIEIVECYYKGTEIKSKEEYDALLDKSGWVLCTFNKIVELCSDSELAKYADRLQLSVDKGVLTLLDDLETGHELKAWWTIDGNTIESGKISG
jgi:prepilin-type N-terminal cleavage/methylation domain-containing protein